MGTEAEQSSPSLFRALRPVTVYVPAGTCIEKVPALPTGTETARALVTLSDTGPPQGRLTTPENSVGVQWPPRRLAETAAALSMY